MSVMDSLMSAGRPWRTCKIIQVQSTNDPITITPLGVPHKPYLLPELPKKRFEVRFGLGVRGTGQFPLNTALHVVLAAVQIFGPDTEKKLEWNREEI